MTEALKPSEVLSRAADLIEPEGAWMQGAFALTRGGRPLTYPLWLDSRAERVCWCLNGAVYEAAGRQKLTDEARPARALKFVDQALAGETATHYWNDAPDRTQAEVVAALRKAADLAREAGQ